MKEEISKIDEAGRAEDYLPPDLLGLSELELQKEKNSRAGQEIEIFSLKEEQRYGLNGGKGPEQGAASCLCSRAEKDEGRRRVGDTYEKILSFFFQFKSPVKCYEMLDREKKKLLA